MTTFKGAVRSYTATLKRMERDQQRRAREAAKRYKELQKQEEIANAAQAVSDYNNYIETIQSLHKNCTESVNWEEVKSSTPPEKPVKLAEEENKAVLKRKDYTPSFFDKLFKSVDKKIKRLDSNIEQAKLKDTKRYELDKVNYQDELNDWNEIQTIAKGIDENKDQSYIDAIKYFNPFADLSELGSNLYFNVTNNIVDVDLKINGDDVIPNYELKQTSTGKLSKKNISKTKFNELYQDHICSSCMRVAREIFAYLPVDYARVNAIAKVLNSSTGHLEEQPILSVIFTENTIKQLNLETIDPSDSLINFVHNMKFSKTNGFNVVDKVELKS